MKSILAWWQFVRDRDESMDPARLWRSLGLLCVVVVAMSGAARANEPALQQVEVFRSGEEGYHTFRIPSVVVTAKGAVLAFCEGRKESARDSGNIDLVLKRSADGGKTWTPVQVVWDDGDNTCGNPCAVVDGDTGTIWLLLTWNRGDDAEGRIVARTSRDTRRVFVSRSVDEGGTWTQPKETTASTKLTTWTWYATGPGAGIQVEHGAHKGRLIIPCDHIEAGTRRHYSHVVFSDDHGQTWGLGGSTPRDQVNECEVVELSSGCLLLNMRNYDRSERTRQAAISRDGGLTWTDQRHVPELIEPVCQASIRRFSWAEDDGKNIVLFSNPGSTKREKMTVRLSYDEAVTWPCARELWEGPSAYSCLVVLPGKMIGCLYERGSKSPYEAIVFARFNVEWLTQRR